MNRELKFRVWSFLSKNFEYFDIYQGANLGIAGGVSVPQQYTGCFDKNNKEIYEGDLVKVTSPCSNENYVATVIYGEAEFCFKVDCGDIKGCWSGDDVEVIGNIFESK
jgi:hypothetical protein